MNYKEARTLAELVAATAPWAEDIYTVPIHPAEQRFTEGPYMVSLSSAFLRADFYSLQDWLEMVRQLEPTPKPTGLPLLEEHLFNVWVRKQLTRTDLDDREQRCSTKDMTLFAHHPYLNTLCVEIPFTATTAPVVDSGDIPAPQPRTPVVPEIMLTVKWTCPVCGSPLALSRRVPTWLDVRISHPGLTHSASGAEGACSADTWVILEGDEEKDQEPEVSFSIQVWQVIHLRDANRELEGEQTNGSIS